MKIYTKTGDKGDTRLFDGTKTRKDDERVDTYGDVDELNSFIGAAATWLALLEEKALVALLADIQRDLFTVGAQLANPKWASETSERSRLDERRILILESSIDQFETELPPLRQFILAGGCPAGALLHVARTVCRRAERRVVALSVHVPVDEVVIRYLNRLSDFLFVLARLVNHRQGQQENPW
jgi:cob(I)alamin adenosyltransferase